MNAGGQPPRLRERITPARLRKPGKNEGLLQAQGLGGQIHLLLQQRQRHRDLNRHIAIG